MLFAFVFVITACEGEKSPVLSNGDSFISNEALSSEMSEGSDASAVISGEGSDMEVFCGGIYEGRERIKFVALGDSIARGFGLKDPKNCAYPAIVCEAVRQRLVGTEVEFYNYAVDGDTTTDLLKLMEHGTKELDGADIVTLSIGANNILLPFFRCLAQLSTVLGDLNGTNESTEDKLDINFVFDSVNKAIRSEQFSAELSAGIAKAKADLEKVLAQIKRRAPDAVIMVMLVYSPYHEVEISLPYIEQKIVFGDLSDKWVGELDSVIKEKAVEAGCIIVDCFEPFKSKDGLLNVAISAIPPKFSIDPHPNLSGHIYIANLHIAELLKQ